MGKPVRGRNTDSSAELRQQARSLLERRTSPVPGRAARELVRDALPSGWSRPYPARPSSPDREAFPMPKVRLSYDGWLALPAAEREKLGLSTGHQLELELVGGAVVLRPTGAAGPAPAEPAATRPRVEATPP